MVSALASRPEDLEQADRQRAGHHAGDRRPRPRARLLARAAAAHAAAHQHHAREPALDAPGPAPAGARDPARGAPADRGAPARAADRGPGAPGGLEAAHDRAPPRGAQRPAGRAAGNPAGGARGRSRLQVHGHAARGAGADRGRAPPLHARPDRPADRLHRQQQRLLRRQRPLRAHLVPGQPLHAERHRRRSRRCPQLDGLAGLRRNVLRRCPGAATQVLPDKSNPYFEEDEVCDPEDTLR